MLTLCHVPDQMLKLMSDGAEPRIIIESLLDHIEKGGFGSDMPGGARSGVLSAGGMSGAGVGTSAAGGEYTHPGYVLGK